MPRNFTEFVAKGGVENTVANVRSGREASQLKRVMTAKYQRLLKMRENGADLLVKDAIGTYGPEVQEYIPPKQLFYDGKTGVFDTEKWIERYLLGIKAFEDKKKEQEGLERSAQQIEKIKGANPPTKREAYTQGIGEGPHGLEEGAKQLADTFPPEMTEYNKAYLKAGGAKSNNDLFLKENSKLWTQFNDMDSHINTQEKLMTSADGDVAENEQRIQNLTAAKKEAIDDEEIVEIQKQIDAAKKNVTAARTRRSSAFNTKQKAMRESEKMRKAWELHTQGNGSIRYQGAINKADKEAREDGVTPKPIGVGTKTPAKPNAAPAAGYKQPEPAKKKDPTVQLLDGSYVKYSTMDVGTPYIAPNGMQITKTKRP